MTTVAQHRLLDLLTLGPGVAPDTSDGYLDLLGDQDQAGPVTGIAQRLMRTTALPWVYERYWRPFLGRVAKGPSGPSMAEERTFARQQLGLRPGSVVLDVACGTGGFTRAFSADLGDDGLAIGLDASRPMLARAVASTPAGAAHPAHQRTPYPGTSPHRRHHHRAAQRPAHVRPRRAARPAASGRLHRRHGGVRRGHPIGRGQALNRAPGVLRTQ